jgi:hypothetical protein
MKSVGRIEIDEPLQTDLEGICPQIYVGAVARMPASTRLASEGPVTAIWNGSPAASGRRLPSGDQGLDGEL